eukprot:GDKJ01003217.1.p1 GENE.GDKJ01003217.1~~GDKJ01003217.1.p1  ORF type:complete len:542 (-),score=97.80 GDKJ01003217.1:75-1700(-)
MNLTRHRLIGRESSDEEERNSSHFDRKGTHTRTAHSAYNVDHSPSMYSNYSKRIDLSMYSDRNRSIDSRSAGNYDDKCEDERSLRRSRESGDYYRKKHYSSRRDDSESEKDRCNGRNSRNEKDRYRFRDREDQMRYEKERSRDTERDYEKGRYRERGRDRDTEYTSEKKCHSRHSRIKSSSNELPSKPVLTYEELMSDDYCPITFDHAASVEDQEKTSKESDTNMSNAELTPEVNLPELERIIRSIKDQSKTCDDFVFRVNQIRKIANILDDGDGINNLESIFPDQWLRKKIRHLFRALDVVEGVKPSLISKSQKPSSQNYSHARQTPSTPATVWTFRTKGMKGAVEVLDAVFEMVGPKEENKIPESHHVIGPSLKDLGISREEENEDDENGNEEESCDGRGNEWMRDEKSIEDYFSSRLNGLRQDPARVKVDEKEQQDLRTQIQKYRESRGETKSLFQMTKEGQYDPKKLQQIAQATRKRIEESEGVWGGGAKSRSKKDDDGMRAYEKEFAIGNTSTLQIGGAHGSFDSKFSSHISSNVT